MKMTREYYENHVDMAVELEYQDGFREWYDMKLCKVDAFLEEYVSKGAMFFSDLDLRCKQSDEHVRKFLNTCAYNQKHNPKFKGMSLWDIIEEALKVELEV